MAVVSACPVLQKKVKDRKLTVENRQTYLYNRRAVKKYRHMLYFVLGLRSLTHAFEESVWGCQSQFFGDGNKN